jgi:hypothetical protein
MSANVVPKATAGRRGVIDPNLLYTTEGLMIEGRMKRKGITEMRQKGGVKPFPVGAQHYYDGAEVAAWIKKQPRK